VSPVPSAWPCPWVPPRSGNLAARTRDASDSQAGKRRSRSTRRRQDAPDLPRRKVRLLEDSRDDSFRRELAQLQDERAADAAAERQEPA
jgi:hypothetical protein